MNYDENKKDGYFLLYRSLFEHWLSKNDAYFIAFLKILKEVNFKENKLLINNELLECNRGESLNSIETWVKIFRKGNDYKWSYGKVKSFFKLLEKDNMIIVKGLSKTTRLTVCNYDSYQTMQKTDNKQINNKQQQTKNVKGIKEINNNTFANDCFNDLQWIESLERNNKVSFDAIKLFISTFENHLVTMQEQKSNLKQFKSHFVNWFGKQNLSQFRVRKIGTTNQ